MDRVAHSFLRRLPAITSVTLLLLFAVTALVLSSGHPTSIWAAGDETTHVGADGVRIEALSSSITRLQKIVADQQMAIDADHAIIRRLQQQLTARPAAGPNASGPFTVSGTDVYLTGYNLHVQSGAGSTAAAPNGLGNLIIGYNETRSSGNNRSGSHNLIVGSHHNYSSYGAIVAGFNNTASAPYTAVTGGYSNIASAPYSSIAGGSLNSAAAKFASVSGGYNGTANGQYSSVTGGYDNSASGDYSSISGGYLGSAGGFIASVSGGIGNTASGFYTSVSGGNGNQATNYYTSVSGGYGNLAFGDYSSVSGGYSNKTTGQYASISGGNENAASGYASSVAGGDVCSAKGSLSSVSGGEFVSESDVTGWSGGGYHSP